MSGPFQPGDRVAFTHDGREYTGTVVGVAWNARRRVAVVTDVVSALYSKSGPRIHIEILEEDGRSSAGGPKWSRVEPENCAAALLRLIELATRLDLGPVIVGQYDPGEWDVTLHDEAHGDCPRYTAETLDLAVSAALADIAPDAAEEPTS